MGLSWAILQFPMLFGGGAAVCSLPGSCLAVLKGRLRPPRCHRRIPSDRSLLSNLFAIGPTLRPVIAAPLLHSPSFTSVGEGLLAAWESWDLHGQSLGFLGTDGPYGGKRAKWPVTETKNK